LHDIVTQIGREPGKTLPSTKHISLKPKKNTFYNIW